MSKSHNQNLTVKFGGCNAGWIRMRLAAGDQSLEISLSTIYDPLPELLAWLEAIVVGVEECGFMVDEEGRTVDFLASKTCSENGRGKTIFSVTPQYEVPPFQITLPTFDLVGIIYRAFCDFSESEEYIPTEWEFYNLERAVHEKLGMSSTEWIDSVIPLSAREMQKALWQLDRSILCGFMGYEENIGTEAELMELTGKTKEEAGGLPWYFIVEAAEWGECLEGNEQSRRQYLEECLTEKGNPSWDGCPWRKMRSPLIEKWLEAEVTPAYSYWKKWVIEKEMENYPWNATNIKSEGAHSK